jgi:hypothetical protein
VIELLVLDGIESILKKNAEDAFVVDALKVV